MTAITLDAAREKRFGTAHADPTIDPGLLDTLPTATIDWNEVPGEVQRDLFDALQLQIRYDRATNTAHGQVTLVGDTGDRVPDAISAGSEEHGPTDRADRSIVVRAPGRIRTCATASGGRCSIP